MNLLEKFLERTDFVSYEDFVEGFRLKVPQHFNFGYDVVDAWAEAEPDRKALLWTNDRGQRRQYTFGEIKELSDRTASWFRSLGIGHGDRVMLVVKRRPQWWLSMVALHKLGATAIPATFLLTPHDIEYRCNYARIKAIVAVGELEIISHIDAAMPSCPTVGTLISTGPYVPEGWLDFDSGIASVGEFERPADIGTNDDIMLAYFTSGTTGEPKMVGHTFTYPLGHIVTAAYWQNLGPDSLHLTLADTGWGKAVWGKLYGQWIAGANVFVYDFDKFVPADVLKQISDEGVTSFCAPPTVFRFMIREDMSRYDLRRLRHCTIAGEALNPAVFDRWYELTGLKLMEGFGQTETTLTLGTFPWMEPKPGSMGRPNPQYDIDLVDAEGNTVATGEQGEIVVRLPADGSRPCGLFAGYTDAPELDDKAIIDGIYHTGDVAWRDSDGYYWFVSRKDDVIKSSGYRIGPFEVENALMTHPAVVECAITGVPDEVRGQVVKATIVLAKEYVGRAGDKLVKDIQDYVKRVTAPYKYPRIIEFVRELPKTISGKIRRVALRDGDSATLQHAASAAVPVPHGKKSVEKSK